MLDALHSAAEAGLIYTVDSAPGIRRVRRGRGHSYLNADGARISAAERKRIEALVIPPAWKDVWICPSHRGHLQATGRDQRGRKQYLYHPSWRAVRDEAKFTQLADFGAALPDLRRRVAQDLSQGGLTRAKVVAAVVSLLDKTLIRVGNEEYRRDNGTFGLTTLGDEHVEIDGSMLRFKFLGKSGIEHEVDLRDRRLARVVRACHELGGRELFTYVGDDGQPVRVDSCDANEYLSLAVGQSVTVKNFRTWGASVIVAEELHDAGGVDDKAVIEAIDLAAATLGNTRTVCRNSYVDPRVIDAARSGSLHDAWEASRSTETMTRAERATLKVITT